MFIFLNIGIYTFLLSIICAAAFLSYRYTKNPVSQVPRPYIFKESIIKKNSSNAPILIIGDRLGNRLSKYKNMMADTISSNLSKKVEIVSIAMDGEGIHRTLEKIKKLGKLPLITIYIGGSEESYEQSLYASLLKVASWLIDWQDSGVY